MDTILQAFRVGGVWMWVILILSAISYLASFTSLAFLAVSMRRPLRLTMTWFGIVLLTMGGAIFVIGVVAYGVGISQMERALEYIDPKFVEEVRLLGTEEALLPLHFSLIMGGFPTLVGLLSLVRGIHTPRQTEPSS